MDIDCSGWYFCGYCRSESYIIDYFPKEHHAYKNFKTKSKIIFEQHECSTDHLKHFEKYYCETCEKQCYSRSEFNIHCETVRHKQRSNITMNCKVCNYSTTDKYKFERHEQSLKHQNAVNGVQKKEYFCEKCSYKTSFKSQMEIHEKSKKHQLVINNNQYEDYTGFLYCNLCCFKTKYQSTMKIHEESKKHQHALTRSKDMCGEDLRCHRNLQ